MRKPVFLAVLAAAFLIQGCGMQRGYIENPFEHNSRQTFIREGTGETGLYIEDEDWCVLIDLHGFKDVGIAQAANFLSQMQSMYINCKCDKIKLVLKKGTTNQWDADLDFWYTY